MARAPYIHDLEAYTSSFSFQIPIAVRFSETDMYGHVNNTVPFTYYEEVRIAYLQSIGLMDEWSQSDCIPVVADLQCDYFTQVYFGDQLQVGVKVAKIGTSSVDMQYLVTKVDGTVAYTGRGTMVQVSKHTGKSVPWSNFARDCLLQTQSN
ncbi:acyl-CoA thioesterase [Bacillus fonticola]|uniref:acyl-CoA thioesterase n=1 Tax=Bacillus fonticola TaxID=2728853 RepID=UPI0014767EBA|nr:thioesterase family protein [Bacillus fonticola]